MNNEWYERSECSDEHRNSDQTLDVSHQQLKTKHQLIAIFKQRKILLPNFGTNPELDKNYEYYNILEFYNRVLLPLPQRIYRHNMHGVFLHKLQDECNRRCLKRKHDQNETQQQTQTQNKLNNNIMRTHLKSSDAKSGSVSHSSTQSSSDAKRTKIRWP